MDLHSPSVALATLVLASGCTQIPDLYPEAADACVEIDQNCQDVLNDHFEADDVLDPLTKAIYLQGMRWFVRWDVDAAEFPMAHRAPGDGTTQQMYNYIAYQIRRSSDDVDDGTAGDIWIHHHTAYLWKGLYLNGLPGPEHPTTAGSIPFYIIDDFLYPDEDATINIFRAAFHACEDGVPEEMSNCFSWWAYSEYYDYVAHGW